jgi:hypothetical protein
MYNAPFLFVVFWYSLLMKIKFETPQFLFSLFITFIAVIISTAYIFFIKNDYSYLIEASCDPETTTCFYRDCSEEDSCYEYQEEIYKNYRIKATEFEKCGGLSCAEQCESGAIVCSEIVCDPAGEEDCYTNDDEYENGNQGELDTEAEEEPTS